MDTLIIDKDYITNNYIIGDNMEKCLKDFITYLKNKNQTICALDRYTSVNNDDTIVYMHHTLFNNEPIFKPLFNQRHNNPDFIYETEILDEITQEDIDRWCKPYILPNSRRKEDKNYREIYTKTEGGILYNYYISVHAFYHKVFDDTIEYPKDITILRVNTTIIN